MERQKSVKGFPLVSHCIALIQISPILVAKLLPNPKQPVSGLASPPTPQVWVLGGLEGRQEGRVEGRLEGRLGIGTSNPGSTSPNPICKYGITGPVIPYSLQITSTLKDDLMFALFL